jgi:hypothetical protein
MTQKNIAAFPQTNRIFIRNERMETRESEPVEFTGLSMRDYFASAAMQGMLCAHPASIRKMMEEEINLANVAYEIADLMMKAR